MCQATPTLSLPGHGVTTWHDLAGKSIAINQAGTIGDSAVTARLQQEGVAGTRLVPIAFANQGLAVAGGNVGAAVMVEPFITQSVQRGDGRILDWIVGGGAPFPTFEETVVGFSNQFIRDHPDRERAFLRAHLQAVRWIAANDQAARAILTRHLGLTDDVGRAMNLVRFSLDGRNDAALLAQTQDVLLGSDPTRTPVPIASLYDETVLNEVLNGGSG